MAVRNVRQLGDPVLRENCASVLDPASLEIAALIDDLRDTLAHWRATTTYGRGIAAPQIGVTQRVIFLNIDQPWPFINPEIIRRSDESIVVWDACLSFLCIFFQVRRSAWIDVRYQDLAGDWHEVHAEGDLSELLQHEIDHLDGVLSLDRITDLKTMVVREEFESRYRDASPYARNAQ